MAAPTATVFATPRYSARELREDDVPLLQALLEANPEYSLAVNGRLPHPDEAFVEFVEQPPAHLQPGRRWFMGLFDADDTLVGVCVVVENLGAPRVWHLAWLLVATALHGSGVAQAVYEAMEAWARQGGAQWLRLGVVQGNVRAERFWERQGFLQVRTREGMDTGGRLNTIRVMAKPLAGGTLDRYLALMPRDQPGSTLP